MTRRPDILACLTILAIALGLMLLAAVRDQPVVLAAGGAVAIAAGIVLAHAPGARRRGVIGGDAGHPDSALTRTPAAGRR